MVVDIRDPLSYSIGNPNLPSFSRNSIAYKQDGTQVVANAPRYEQGKFGQGVMVEEGTTNFVANSSIITPNGSNPSAWTPYLYAGTPTASWLNGGFQGKCININCPSASDRAFWECDTLFSAKANQVYTLSGWINKPGLNQVLMIQETLSGPTYIMHGASYTGVTRVDGVGTTWYQLAVSFTTASSYTGWTWGIRVDSSMWAPINCSICDVQLEEKAYNTSYVRNDSVSVGAIRSAEMLTIPNQVINLDRGAVHLIYKANWTSAQAKIAELVLAHFVRANSSGAVVDGAGWFGYYTNGCWGIPDIGLSYADTFIIGDIRDFYITWDSANVYLYVNGVKVATATKPSNWSLISTGLVYIGEYVSGGLQCNGLIDDFSVMSITPTDAQISAWYQSNAPLPVDQYTTYKLNFDSNLKNAQYKIIDVGKPLLYPVRHAVSKIEWLDWNENVLADYTSYETDGNVTFDKSSDIRRTSSISLINNSAQFVPDGAIVNMKAKYRLYSGMNVLGNQFLYQKGVFVLDDPEAVNSAQGQLVTIRGSDKWTLLDGKLGGVLTDTYQIANGTNVVSAIISLAQLFGETKFNFVQSTVTTPYTVTKDPGSNAADLIKELALIISYEVFYDQYGYLVGRPIFNANSKPVAWDYSITYKNLLMDIRRNPGWSKIKNYVKVIGATDVGKTYKGIAQDSNVNSPTYTGIPPAGIGQKSKVITANELYTDDLCSQRAQYELTQGLKADDRVTVKIIPNPAHVDDEVISLNDSTTGAIGNHEIQRISEALNGTDMTLEVWKVR